MHPGLAQVILQNVKTKQTKKRGVTTGNLLLGRVPFLGLASAVGCLKPLMSSKRHGECEHGQATEQEQVAESVGIERLCLTLQVARFKSYKEQPSKSGRCAICCHKNEASKSRDSG